MTKAPTPTEKSKKQCDNKKTPPKTAISQPTISDRLRTVSWGNDNHPTYVVKPVYGIQTLPLLLFINVFWIWARLCKGLFPVVSPARALYWTEFIGIFFIYDLNSTFEPIWKGGSIIEHLPTAREHDSFYRSNNWTFRKKKFSTKNLLETLFLTITK